MEKRFEELLRGAVACNSVNPAWEGGPGEAKVCHYVSDVLSSAGLYPETQEVAPGRTNVVCTVAGKGEANSLMLNAHVDVVGVDGMDNQFNLRRVCDRLFVRGPYLSLIHI